MAPFAGYNMPVQYELGVLKEHIHTREKAGLFDVSHMGQIQVVGDNLAEVLERVLPADLESLDVGKQCYSFLLNHEGGVIDDLMICRREYDSPPTSPASRTRNTPRSKTSSSPAAATAPAGWSPGRS